VQHQFDGLTQTRERQRLALLVVGTERPSVDTTTQRNPLALTGGIFDREQLILCQDSMEER
jgi:hypothetical protein